MNRTIQYDRADIVLLCVACDDRASLESARVYHTEILSIINAPIFIVLTKTDKLGELTESDDRVTFAEIEALKTEKGM